MDEFTAEVVLDGNGSLASVVDDVLAFGEIGFVEKPVCRLDQHTGDCKERI